MTGPFRWRPLAALAFLPCTGSHRPPNDGVTDPAPANARSALNISRAGANLVRWGD